jgi:hypothetical protein
MLPRPLNFIAATLLSTGLMTGPFAAALAWDGGALGQKPTCGGAVKPSGYRPVSVTKIVNIYKPVTIEKSIDIYKPVTINKNINVYKPVTINKNVDITKNIDASKNVTINKNIEINKSIVINKGGSAEASAFAAAMAQAGASASSNVVVYGGGYYETVNVNNHGDIGAVRATADCHIQEASVVKAIHAVCVSPEGREFPASHMTGDTWIDTALEGEILRCIPGAHLKITVGDVLQTDQGVAGTYASGQMIECAENEALRHFKDGMLKCAPKVPVKDCTERTNLRRYGTGDMFFSYRADVCVAGQTASRELDVTGMALQGGVGTDQ